MNRTVLVLAILATVAAAQEPARRGFNVKIVEPADGGVVLGRSRIAAEVEIADRRLIERVEFAIDDRVVFVDREPPWEFVYDFGEVGKTWVVRVAAFHAEGIKVDDAIVTRRPAFVSVEFVNRVVLAVSARDKDGHFVTDLTRDELSVLEDGQPQKILDFYRDERPFHLALLLDSSGSIKEEIKYVHEAASAFVDSLQPDDRALVIDYDDKVYLLQGLTSDREALRQAISSTEAIGGTALYDAIDAAFRLLAPIDGRKAVVVLSDGDDSSSRRKLDQLIDAAQSSDLSIFAIALGGGADGGPRKSVMRKLSAETGGRFHLAQNPEDLAKIYRDIADELRSQYYVSYSTTNERWDGRLIPIGLRTTREGIDVRTRAGYLARRLEIGAPSGGNGSSGGINSSGDGS